ncbi:MAG: tRNA pseudouridine(55) synthase TruB [Actinobacteria bacterium]|jgi:tRNA pseudouridine55 synthase|uniref:tRNA pseudouridine(55) synthase n=1 Tax=freshwater metagenome TaxID=449393 RepID=A0A6J7UHV2_9ZZZZ|nr:tRNA pseudouridine(55) synthase TruB [Actinomycetota bacterium]
MDGFLLIDKAGGMTSHDVVAMARKKLDTKKVGHAGTLDPMATGVLVLGVGIATRLLTYITDGKKTYEATILLGKSTHTDDKDGDLTFTGDQEIISKISDDQIKGELAKFIGKIKQRPSSVSAIKIDGKTAHARVRAGESVEIAERDVTIYELITKEIRNLSNVIEVDISVTCSAGTYIRAIARDLGSHLKIGGHLITLRRSLVSPFSIEQCKQVKDADLIPVGEVIEKLFPTRNLDLAQSSEIRFGRVIEQNSKEGVFAALDNQGNFVALLENKLQGNLVVAAPILVAGSGQ